jgi:hypothetical protein
MLGQARMEGYRQELQDMSWDMPMNMTVYHPRSMPVAFIM